MDGWIPTTDVAQPHSARRRDWLLVDATNSTYADAVVADLTDILGTQCGRALLREIHTGADVVTIERPAQTQPPNAWVQVADRPAPGVAATAQRIDEAVATAAADARCRIRVAYDPIHWPTPIDPRSPPSDTVLFALLQQAGQATKCQGPNPIAEADAPPLYVSDAVSRYQRERGRA